MDATYGPANTLQEYVRIAQTMSYNNERAMFEAYGRNKYRSTGVIQWMLNNAWPSMIWHLYDYYLDAGGGYYGTKKALEPIHAQYSYDDHSIYVVNSAYQPTSELVVTAKVFDQNLKQLVSKQADLKVDADASSRAIVLPDSIFSGDNSLYFVQLTAKDQQGEIVSRNFYWVPAKLTTFAWDKADYTHTPAITQANMQTLRTLPQVTLVAKATRTASGLEVTLRNPSKGLAFQVAVAAQDAKGSDIVPTLWSDNYVELMPGESRTLTADLSHSYAGHVSVVVSGWNFSDITVPLK
jgi:exo-1,4-beta-D-glucosaminidase